MNTIRIATLFQHVLPALCLACIATSTIASHMEEDSCSSTESEVHDVPAIQERGARLRLEAGVKKQRKTNKDARYNCPIACCGSSYVRRYDLKMHLIKKHPEQVPLHPEICQTQKSSKVNKNWPCPVESCSSGYSRKGDLKLHLIKKHAEECKNHPHIMVSKSDKANKSWQCPADKCECGYMRKFDLKSHIELKHPDMDAENF